MSRSSRRTARRLLVGLLAALVLTAAAVVGGVLLLDREAGERGGGCVLRLATALGSLDLTTTTVLREAFCDRVDPADAAAAVGVEDVQATAYVDGDSAAVTPTVTDVVHEHGCAWTAADGRAARAWVFAPPVTPQRAGELVAGLPVQLGEAAGTPCTPLPEPALGTPGVSLSCPAGALTTVSARGLLGDAWLSCSLTGAATEPVAELAERADRWCASVVLAAQAD